MKKNKMMTAAMGVMLLGAMVLPIHAEKMTVTYRQPNAYKITIPSSVDLSAGETSNIIEVKDVNLEPGKEIKIKISSGVDKNGVIELSREQDENTKAVTTISASKDGKGIALNTDFVSFTTNGEQMLYYSAIEAKDGEQIKAGSYKGKIVFAVTAPKIN